MKILLLFHIIFSSVFTNAQQTASGTNTDVATTAAMQIALAAKQSVNAHLTAISGLAPSANDVLQFKSSAWVNRSMAQLKTDLSLVASDIASGTFADARIAQSNVTQHQSAIQIAESQVTNLLSDLAGKASATHTHAQSDVTNLVTDMALAKSAFARVTGSNATTTGQSLTNITGLSVALIANAVYEFEGVLSVSTTAVTTGTAYGVQYSAAGATIEAHITGSSTSTAAKTERISALNTATGAYLTTASQTGGMKIFGIIATGANAGNLTIQHLKLTSGTSTVFINSYLKVTRIQ